MISLCGVTAPTGTRRCRYVRIFTAAKIGQKRRQVAKKQFYYKIEVTLYCTALYCTALYCTVLYCTVSAVLGGEVVRGLAGAGLQQPRLQRHVVISRHDYL